MSWGFVAGAAISVVGGAMASRSASKASDAASAAAIQDSQLSASVAREQLAQQRQLADRDAKMQEDQFKYFKDRQVGIDKVANEVTQRELAMAEETQAQGRDLYNYQKEVFRPVEQSLVAQAMRESTPEYYEKYASEAVARAAQAEAVAQGTFDRDMASMGVNPNSGAYTAGKRGLQLQSAAVRGATANDARDRAESFSWARKAEVAGLGKGLVGAGNASYGLAQGSNANAVAATNGANSQAAGTLGTPTQYGQLAIGAGSSVISGANDLYRSSSANVNAARQTAATQAASTGQAFSALGQLAARRFGN